MRVNVYACVVLVFCVATSLQDTSSSSCSDGPKPKSLRVQGCDVPPCKLVRGKDLIAEWDFDAQTDVKEMKPRVRVTIAGGTIDYPYPEQKACESLSKGTCPLKKGEEATYSLKMPISKAYPLITLKIEFALVDENNKVQVCFKLSGKVVNK